MASSEQDLIRRAFAPLAEEMPGAFGLADDAGLLTPSPGCEIVATTDALVAGVHFLRDDPPDLIARKALRVNLSDLAAKGARPTAYLLTVALDSRSDEIWLEAFVAGLAADQVEFGCHLLGGDTVSTPGPFTVSIAAFGDVAAGKMVHRSGAQPGDAVFVTGTIGDGALGLALRKGDEIAGIDDTAGSYLVDRWLLPQPRVALAGMIADHASAAMDVSDGFAGDLATLCAASGVGARVAVHDVPLSPAAASALHRDQGLQERILTGGDDYELLFCVPPDKIDPLIAIAAETDIRTSQVGRIGDASDGVLFIGAGGEPLQYEALSYSHLP